jgi:UDP-N-acetylmuramoyl-L-alanyl-D-glutamate--2,6-diaminopimelate ligase
MSELATSNQTPDDTEPRTVCVTGTNGKTTTTSMVEAIVAAAGEPSARITTLGSWVAGQLIAEDATSEAFSLTVRRAREVGVKTLAIETTSQALAEGFAAIWPADVGVFTNLSRDHLDYHGTPERYLAAKAQLFMHLREGGTAVLNAADGSSALLDEVTPPGVRRACYAARALDPGASHLPLSLSALRVEVHRGGTTITLAPSPLAEALSFSITLRIVGEVHAENALAAALAASSLGYPPRAIVEGLERFAGVPGRFQIVHDRPLVVVDFAHTPDALSRTLALARKLVSRRGGRVVCVFGCGGGRDPGKRPEMGRAAALGADVVIVTNDNPRGEDPDAIADAVMAGAAGPGQVSRILDRAGAIARGIELADPYDIVVVAGKGHERTQLLGGLTVPFDDAEVVKTVCGNHSPRGTKHEAGP